MWRPGDAKPAAGARGKRKSPPGRRNNNSSQQRNKNNNTSPSKNGGASFSKGSKGDITVENSHSTNNNGPVEDAVAPQKKLSGALMNMKFMKRKAIQQQERSDEMMKRHHATSTPQSTNSKSESRRTNASPGDQDPMDMELEACSPLLIHASSTPTALATTTTQDVLVDMTPATCSDMYGISVAVIGRRSFGGFNRPIEDTWKASYRAIQEESDGDRHNRGKVSDAELLQRYATLVQHRNHHGEDNNNNDDSTRRPVGNLGNKVKPRKNMGSAEKRKRR